MNGTYYQNPTFPNSINPNNTPPEMNNYTSNIEAIPGEDYLPMQQSYIENILRLNKGKKAKVYVSFPDSVNWKDKIFDGTIRQAGRDHLVISDINDKWYLIPMVYLDYVEFEEEIIYRPGDKN